MHFRAREDLCFHMAKGPSHWTENFSHADGWAMHPPIVVVAKSAKLRFRLRRKLRPLPCSSSPHRAGRGGGPIFGLAKRETGRARSKEKKRLGGSVCACAALLPPAGGRLAALCGSQRRKRAALGMTFGPGRSGIHPAPLFAAAGRWLMGLLQRADEGIGPYDRPGSA